MGVLAGLVAALAWTLAATNNIGVGNIATQYLARDRSSTGVGLYISLLGAAAAVGKYDSSAKQAGYLSTLLVPHPPRYDTGPPKPTPTPPTPRHPTRVPGQREVGVGDEVRERAHEDQEERVPLRGAGDGARLSEK